MEVTDMLDEREYLNKRQDYTGWNDRAEAADELVEDAAAAYARQESRAALAAWNASPLIELEEAKEPRTLRHMKAEALRRMESGARTERDFRRLVAEYDRIEANKQRGIELTELPRGELPWEQEVSSLPVVFPAWMNMPLEKQLQKGNFIDAIFDCPYELRELVTNSFYARQFDALTVDQKFVAYFYFLRQWKTARIAALKDSSPRAIRKIKSALEANLQEPVYQYLLKRAERPSLSKIERLFLTEYAEARKKPGFKGGISRTLKRDKKRPPINRFKIVRRQKTPIHVHVDSRGVWQLPEEENSESLVCVTIRGGQKYDPAFQEQHHQLGAI